MGEKTPDKHKHNTNTNICQKKRFHLVMIFKLLFLSHLPISTSWWNLFVFSWYFLSSAGRVTWNEDVGEVKEERRREGSWDILDHPDPSPDLRNTTNDKTGLTAAVIQLDDALSSLNIQNADLGTK